MIEITDKMLEVFNKAGSVEDGLRAAIGAMVPAAPASAFPEDLVARLDEILTWRRTGVAELPALNAYADEKLSALTAVDHGDVLRIAEDKTFMEAARLVVGLARKKDD